MRFNGWLAAAELHEHRGADCRAKRHSGFSMEGLDRNAFMGGQDNGGRELRRCDKWRPHRRRPSRHKAGLEQGHRVQAFNPINMYDG